MRRISVVLVILAVFCAPFAKRASALDYDPSIAAGATLLWNVILIRVIRCKSIQCNAAKTTLLLAGTLAGLWQIHQQIDRRDRAPTYREMTRSPLFQELEAIVGPHAARNIVHDIMGGGSPEAVLNYHIKDPALRADVWRFIFED